MIADRRHQLTDDLISELIRAEDDGDRLTHDELLSLAGGLLMAGTDTTRNQLAASVQVLCDHPDQWALLAQHPELAANAVEETMRHSPVTFRAPRTAVEDVELGGVVIPAGTLVVANTAAANRDPAVYEDPDRLDITREAPPAMLTFGGGAHYCLGANLARLELAEALKVMTQRMPRPRRTGPAPWKPLTATERPDHPAHRIRRRTLNIEHRQPPYGADAVLKSRKSVDQAGRRAGLGVASLGGGTPRWGGRRAGPVEA